MNFGLKKFIPSNCTYITFIQNDCHYNPNFIKSLIDLNADFSYGAFNVNNITINYKYNKVNDLLNNYKGLKNFMWSKNAIKKIGSYDISYYDYLIRTFKCINNIKYTNICVTKCAQYNDEPFTKEVTNIYKYLANHNVSSNVLVYYSKISWNLLFQRPHQIMRFFNKQWFKIFITSDNIIKFEEQYNLLIIPYNFKTILFNNIKPHTLYYTDSRLHDEIMELRREGKINKILFDLIDAPINEFAVWKPKLNVSVNNADYVMYSHPKLIEYLININNRRKYYYISNACDYELFSKAKTNIYPKPQDIPKTSKPILGYYGAFSEWLDYDLIKKYADEDKYHILMIGGIPNSSKYNIRFEHKNITWLNHKSYDELPIYLSWFDKCFMPFKICELTKYVNPCKLWEYMASGKEIITQGIDIDMTRIMKYNDICDKINMIIDITKNKFINSNRLVYYSKTSWKQYFDRSKQIMKFFDNRWLKVFLTLDDYLDYDQEHNLLIVPYHLRDELFKSSQTTYIYYTDPLLYDEIKTFKKCKILFDLTMPPIEKCKDWTTKLNDVIKHADCVIYSHPELVKFLNNVDTTKEYHYIPNGCDYEHFTKTNKRIGIRPKDIPITDKPILGYYGNDILDYDLIKNYAESGNYHILIIGESLKQFEHKNITWLSNKTHDEIILYLSWFDICFLPLKNTEFNKYINPHQLYEYIISNKKIIKNAININIYDIRLYDDISNKIKYLITDYVKIKEYNKILTYIINLDENIARFRCTYDNLKKSNLNLEIKGFSIIKKVNRNIISYHGHDNLDSYTDKQIGHLLAHLELIKEYYLNSNKDYIMICKDDIVNMNYHNLNLYQIIDNCPSNILIPDFT